METKNEFSCFFQRLAILFLLFGILVLPEIPAFGQITASDYVGPGDFAYDVHFMPDLDQARSGLPGDGAMYCIPTACMNLCAFAANFGFPGLPPGPGVWQGPQGHQNMTNAIGFMGLPEFMNTDPLTGTDSTGKFNGMTNWIADAGQQLCFVMAYPSDNYWPKIDNAALHGANGAIVQVSYGRYVWQQTVQPYLIDRNGGHGVTLKLAFANNGQILGPRLIHYRNPASDDGNLFSNSTFVSDYPDTAANIQIGTDIYSGIPTDYNVTSLFNPPFFDGGDDTRYRIMDSYLALYPQGGVFFDENQVNTVFVNGGMGFISNEQPVPFSPPFGQSIVAAIPGTELDNVLALVPAPGRTDLYRIPHDGRFEDIADLPIAVTKLALGFGHTVYAVRNNTIFTLNVVPGENADTLSTTTLPGPTIDALTYDHELDTLFVAAGDRLWFIRPSLAGDGTTEHFFTIEFGSQPASSGIQALIAASQQKQFAVLDNGVIVSGQIDPRELVRRSMFRRTIEFETVMFDVPVNDAHAISFDSYGRMYVSDLVQGLLEFEQNKQGQWELVNDPHFGCPPFCGLQGRSFVAFQNRVNVRERDLDPAQWYNIRPSEVVPHIIVPDN